MQKYDQMKESVLMCSETAWGKNTKRLYQGQRVFFWGGFVNQLIGGHDLSLFLFHSELPTESTVNL